ncbi:MAG TPA: class I SAM-dependent methyltransferase, partial [Thermoplasmatales archaeon]|nr:class I SAM-dependent methyltransferase [Thermoplasmatales archaeon]
MKKISPFHRRSAEELDDFLKKLELQAIETAEERIPLYIKVGIKDAEMILDVGCGPGMVTRDIATLTKGIVIGVDASEEMISIARNIL